MKCEICKEKEADHVHYIKWLEKPMNGNHRVIAKKHPELFQDVCTLCHAKIHDIEPKMDELKKNVVIRDRLLKQKIVVENQLKGFGNIELKVPDFWNQQSKIINSEIRKFDKEIKKLINSGEYLIWNWLKNIKGISEITAAKFISYIDIDNTPTISALWRYCGLDPNYIRRRKGMTQEEAKRCGNPYLKKEILGILSGNFIKQRTPIYRDIYDNIKEKELKDGLTKGHADKRAKRKMSQIFLSHLWVIWRKLEGLEVTEPYSKSILGHDHYIHPPFMEVVSESQ
jgi:hypothetical protein